VIDDKLHFEDFTLGQKFFEGTYRVSKDEILEFDPQPHHLDDEAGKHSMLGGLSASGWHTAAIWMKLAIAERDRAKASGDPLMRSGVSPGFEDMRWLKPVRPGTTLHYTSETIEKVELRSRPELGLVKTRNEAWDEKGELVFSFVGKGFVRRNPAAKV
jgi:acyl dehydratase